MPRADPYRHEADEERARSGGELVVQRDEVLGAFEGDEEWRYRYPVYPSLAPNRGRHGLLICR